MTLVLTSSPIEACVLSVILLLFTHVGQGSCNEEIKCDIYGSFDAVWVFSLHLLRLETQESAQCLFTQY